MPISYRIDAERGTVFTTIEGRFTDDELIEHIRRLAADPRFRPDFREYLDATAITEMAVTAAGNRAAARIALFGPGARRAFVASSDTTYGLARMYQLLRAPAGDDLRVFRHARDAHTWLADGS